MRVGLHYSLAYSSGFRSSSRGGNRALATMAGLGTGAGAGAPVVKVYHEKSMILLDVSRVLACLYEKNVQFETVKDSYKDILRLQSTRSVPVPFYDGTTFRQESRAIYRYIAETYDQRGYPFLLGKDVLERASIEQWLRHEEHAFDPPSRALFCHLAFPLHDEDMCDIDREKRKLEEVLEVYEQRLGESEFLAGNKFTLADLVHLPNTHHIVTSTSEEFAYLYDSRKNVQRWWNTISARDSWQQVVKDMQDVEEQYQREEQEQQQLEQQWQWQSEPPPTYAGRTIRTTKMPVVQRAMYTSGPEVHETPSDQRSIEKTPYAQQPSEQEKKAAADQRDAAHLPKHVAFKDIQDEIASQVRTRGAKDSTKEAREADQKRAASAPTRELPPGSQNTPEARSADLKVSESSPIKEGGTNEDDRFSTKRLRKMLEQSDPAALKPQSTDMQPPLVQAAGARDPHTPITADERRATSPLKGGMAPDDRGATQPRKSPSINEQQPAPQMPSQSPPGESATPPAPASDGRSTTLQGSITDARGGNEAVKPSIANPRGISTTPMRQASTPGTQSQTAAAADQLADQAPPASSFADRRNEKTGIIEASQTATVAPEAQPGGRAPNSSGNKQLASKDSSN